MPTVPLWGRVITRTFSTTTRLRWKRQGTSPQPINSKPRLTPRVLPPSVNQQDRDLLRARLISGRKQDGAEAIYRKWIAYWKTAGAPPNVDPRTALKIRTAAMAGYTHFLSVHGRSREALAMQAQLAAMDC